MTGTRTTTIRLDARLVDKVKKALGAKSRTEAVHIALREIVALEEFKKLILEHGGKHRFEGHGIQDPSFRPDRLDARGDRHYVQPGGFRNDTPV